eukprot:TRINITY_DN18443_c0_g1_i1.p1 TRINITY_DN18443_c0_g1~~TRINITY_DN18443_c0_g1_i1.p1  ORF type:complete len:491 (-),score=130.88 TRINITY_DN18443_c0_g1_i1:329-1801(-)
MRQNALMHHIVLLMPVVPGYDRFENAIASVHYLIFAKFKHQNMLGAAVSRSCQASGHMRNVTARSARILADRRCFSSEPAFAASVGALDGVRVLDLSRILAGPYCAMVLGDMGAEVLKVEHPTRGDDTRSWGPPFTASGGQSAYFVAVNRNKKSIAVDMKKKDGLEIVRRLAAQSDVVIENFVPGKADSLGFGYEALSALNPRLIYCSLTGFGPDGPYKDRLAYDVMASAMGGLMGITGPENGEPVKVGVAVTDITAGLFAHGAILAALYARERTGRGQKVDTSLLEAQVAVLANVGSNYLIGGLEARRLGTAHASIVPYQGFMAKDGHIMVGALNDGQFVRLCNVLGAPELAFDPRFVTNPQRVKHRGDLIPMLNEHFRKRNTSEWVELLESAQVPCGPVNSMAQVFSDPQVLHRKMVEEVDHPTAGRIKLAGIPVKFSGTPGSIRLPPPLLGQHTADVLRSLLGYSDADLVRLRAEGVCTFADAAALE